MKYKTTLLTKEKGLSNRGWKIIDAKGQTTGRLCTIIAELIRGKHKADFTPHVECGDFVVVINADKVEFKGKKWDQKKYYRHSGYAGGLREQSAREVLEKHPERIIENAVKGMLPKTRLGKKMFGNLKVYAGSVHPHGAQRPEMVELSK
ncbi:UNVERIFIED_CONTAM: hypothetical protein GTU68_051876 [Idotea baltica]|nr:hypothetical protein [Idotea baltica]